MAPLRRMLLGALVSLIVALTVVGVFLTQPLLSARRRQSDVPAVDPERLQARVAALTSVVPRSVDQPENLARVADFLAGDLERSGARMSEQEVSFERRTYRNVVASFGPETPDRIVVGAHYDAYGPFPGADDNASGVAGLLGLAPLLRSWPLATRVDLVAFALEEPPAFGSPGMGSAVHAAALRAAGIPLRAMICLEMVGCFSDLPGSQTFPVPLLRAFYPSRGNFIAVVGRPRDVALVRRIKASMRSASGLPVRSINAPRRLLGVDLSDHASFWDAGYSAVMITDTAFYRNDRYHTERDTPETLDYARMAKVVQGVFLAVCDLAGHAPAPRVAIARSR
jgi:hypothetical protein